MRKELWNCWIVVDEMLHVHVVVYAVLLLVLLCLLWAGHLRVYVKTKNQIRFLLLLVSS